MRKKSKFWFIQIIMVGLLTTLTNGCKKDDAISSNTYGILINLNDTIIQPANPSNNNIYYGLFDFDIDNDKIIDLSFWVKSRDFYQPSFQSIFAIPKNGFAVAISKYLHCSESTYIDFPNERKIKYDTVSVNLVSYFGADDTLSNKLNYSSDTIRICSISGWHEMNDYSIEYDLNRTELSNQYIGLYNENRNVFCWI